MTEKNVILIKSSSDGSAHSKEKRTLRLQTLGLSWKYSQNSETHHSSFHGSLEIYLETVLFYNEVRKNEI